MMNRLILPLGRCPRRFDDPRDPQGMASYWRHYAAAENERRACADPDMRFVHCVQNKRHAGTTPRRLTSECPSARPMDCHRYVHLHCAGCGSVLERTPDGGYCDHEGDDALLDERNDVYFCGYCQN